MSGQPSQQQGPVLAAPPRRHRRLVLVSIGAAALALALAGVGINAMSSQGPALIATLTGPLGSHGTSSAAFSPDGKALAILDADGSTQFWDVATSRVTATLTSPQCRSGEAQVLFSRDGKMLAVIGSPRTCL